LWAYERGLFPWPISKEWPLAWFSPDPRGVLFFQHFHPSRRLIRELKKNHFEARINTCFEKVLEGCTRNPQRHESWITPALKKGLVALHHQGYCYSIEVFKHGQLAGGLYGMNINSFVSGESMFYLQPNASKFALIFLMEYLQQKGIDWIDTQMTTPVVRAMGGHEISRRDFLLLAQTRLKCSDKGAIFPPAELRQQNQFLL
ncbi:MAG: leucyl/phenylalanyl-tRNA--protein transferase, partial [Pseudomonadota bacterium]